jgi:hypothetical protein
VRGIVAERQLMLAAVAILGIAISLAVTDRRHEHARKAALPPAQGSYSALVGASGAKTIGKTTDCGILIGAHTMGIASPVLPCGAQLYLTFRGRHVLTSVVGRSAGSGREFDLTRALARHLGIAGVRRIRWSYAGND